MKGNKTILVPIDFSPHSEEALTYAMDLARDLSKHLIVLHVVHDPAEAPGYYSPKNHKKSLRKIKDLAADRFKEFMTQFAEDHAAVKKIQLETRLVRGLVVSRILEVVDDVNPFMVVMGSAGRTGLANLMLGSKAEQVVRLSPKPVTIVKLPQNKNK